MGNTNLPDCDACDYLSQLTYDEKKNSTVSCDKHPRADQKIERLSNFSNEGLLLEIQKAKKKPIPNGNYILGLKEEWLRREKKNEE